MDYNHIKNYLEKFKSIIFSKEENYNIIINIIKNNTGILLEKKLIQINGTVLNIKSSPLVKGEILIHKNQILLDLSKILVNLKIKDIR